MTKPDPREVNAAMREALKAVIEAWKSPVFRDSELSLAMAKVREAHRDGKDCRADNTGLDDGPYLPGRAPRKRPAMKTSDETCDIRARAWATRREKYGERGHR